MINSRDSTPTRENPRANTHTFYITFGRAHDRALAASLVGCLGMDGAEPLLAKRKKARKKKKKKKAAPRAVRGFVTSSRATPAAALPEAPPTPAPLPATETSSSPAKSKAAERHSKSQQRESARLQQTWSLHLPAPLANMFAASKRDNVPSIHLDGKLEAALVEEITRLEGKTLPVNLMPPYIL